MCQLSGCSAPCMASLEHEVNKAMEGKMTSELPLPALPDYVAKNMKKLDDIGCGDMMDFKDTVRMFLAWAKDYGDDDYIATVEWLSLHPEHYEKIRDSFLIKTKKGEEGIRIRTYIYRKPS